MAKRARPVAGDSAPRLPPQPPRSQPIAFVLGVAALVLLLAALGQGREMQNYRRQVEQACAGRIAGLDLTEWVEICRQP